MWMKFNSEIIVWSLHGPGCVWTPQLSPKNSHLVRFGTVNGRYPLWFAHIGFTTISIHSASLIVIFDKFLFLYFCCFFPYKLKWSLLNMYILWCILTIRIRILLNLIQLVVATRRQSSQQIRQSGWSGGHLWQSQCLLDSRKPAKRIGRRERWPLVYAIDWRIIVLNWMEGQFTSDNP